MDSGAFRARCFAVAAVLAGVLLLVGGGPGAAAGDGPVLVVDVTGTIDLGLAPYLDRILRQAERDGAAAVLLKIDTPGGRLDAALRMRESLLASPARTIAYVDRMALSAGALVAIASEEIHVAPGAVMGAATPVTGTGEPTDEKVVSAVRTTFEATAEQRGRDPRLAEAMVDPDVEVPDLVERGKLLTLTGEEALEWGYADGTAADRAALLAGLDLDDRPLVQTSPSLAERLVRVVSEPVVASLLLTVGMLMLIGDLLAGGVGVPSAAGAGILAVFFWGHHLAGLAGWEDAALVVLGIALILVELFVVPGFGVAGILGLGAVLGGAFLAMLNRDFDFVAGADLARAGAAVGVAFALVLAGVLVLIVYLSRHGRSGLVLGPAVGSGTPLPQRSDAGWLRWFGGTARRDEAGGPAAGRRPPEEPGTAGTGRPSVGSAGTVVSDLRPSGTAEIGGHRVDVVTEGEYLATGEPVEVLRDDGYRLVVRRRRGGDVRDG